MGSQHLPPSLLNQSAHKKICRIKKIPPTVCILIEHFPSTRTRFDSKTRRQMMSVRCDDERSVGLGSWSMTAAAVCHAHPDHSLSPEVELIPSFDGLHGTDWSGCQRATPQSRRFWELWVEYCLKESYLSRDQDTECISRHALLQQGKQRQQLKNGYGSFFGVDFKQSTHSFS